MNNAKSLVATELEIDRTANGEYYVTVVDYFLDFAQVENLTKRLQLPQTFGTYKEACKYGRGWLAL